MVLVEKSTSSHCKARISPFRIPVRSAILTISTICLLSCSFNKWYNCFSSSESYTSLSLYVTEGRSTLSTGFLFRTSYFTASLNMLFNALKLFIIVDEERRSEERRVGKVWRHL